MAGESSVGLLRNIQTLFDSGTACGLSDRQLLERFEGRRDASAEAAFEVLVLRHGPMVLRVCSNVLRDPTDAQDAFQATFLVLVRRSRAIRKLESLGSWLYGVAHRVSARARVEAARRRAAERRGGLRVVTGVDSRDDGVGDREELGPAVQEEVRRLPEKYRAVVVLCYWEGLTQEQAAAQLGCPLGTVRSRLARGRTLLHRRLTGRGLAPLAGLVAASFDSASAGSVASRLSSVPSQLIQSTVRAAARVAAGEAPVQVVSSAAVLLVQRVLWSMTMIKICKMMTVFFVVGLVVVGVSLWAQQPDSPRPRPRLGPRSERVVQQKAKAPEQRKSGPAHVVEPPDLIIVEVLEALPGRPISGERLVRPDGTISLGFYGDIHVAGLTLPEVKEKIIQHLREFISDESLDLVRLHPGTDEPMIDEKTKEPVKFDPRKSSTVFVDVTAYNSKQYYVQGDVQSPGRLAYTGGETVLDVLQFAGGLLPTADRSKIRLIRSFPKGSPIQVLPIDYEEISMGTDSSTNYQILPYDRLVIPRAPDSQPTELPSARSSPRSPTLPDSTYFPGLSTTDPADKQLQSLRAVERHLSEVEKKLDTIILEMRINRGRTKEKSPEKSGTEPDRTRPGGPEPEN
ncbi:MAG: sigma-70 family RNA polymerase sigma factor [Isosphaerales bacterium]